MLGYTRMWCMKSVVHRNWWLHHKHTQHISTHTTTNTGIGYRVNYALNKSVYGADATWESILDGSQTAPAAFAPLYELLQSLMQPTQS